MMIGEYDFGSTFTANAIKDASVMTDESFFTKNLFPVLVQIFFLGMIFLGSIIIANLITGLTVYNIGQLYKEAEVYKLGTTVHQIDSAENLVHNSKLFHYAKKLMPHVLGKTSVFEKLGPENFLVCVKPNEFGTLDDSQVRLASSKELTVFSFDKHQNMVGKSLGMSIPSWIVKNTFEKLEKRDKLLKELSETLTKDDFRAKITPGSSFDEDPYRELKTPTLNRLRKSEWSQQVGGSNETIYGFARTPALPRQSAR